MSVAHLEYVDRALGIAESARGQGLELRILGSLAYRLHCPANIALFEAMKRDLTDIDFAALSSQRKPVREFFLSLGYDEDQDVLVTSEGKRFCFTEPETRMNVDVFFDELYFCHRISLKDRLALDYPTITPTDLLLEKMQIVEINPKDVKDSTVLLLEHSLTGSDSDAIDVGYVAKLLAADWGFYYTVTTNLDRLRNHVQGDSSLRPDQIDVIRTRIDELVNAIEKEGKTQRWKLRARIGPRVKWYQEVAEKTATY